MLLMYQHVVVDDLLEFLWSFQVMNYHLRSLVKSNVIISFTAVETLDRIYMLHLLQTVRTVLKDKNIRTGRKTKENAVQHFYKAFSTKLIM